MGPGQELVPIRWPAGWRDPALLAELENSPINLLLLPPGPEFGPVRSQAQRRGLACWEITSAGEISAPQGRFRIVPRAELDWNATGPIVAARDCVWPAIATESTASAGPTGVPWVDSNGWLAQLVRTMLPGREFWLFFEPPANTVLRPEGYALAVADAEAFGARWAIAFDESVQRQPQRVAPVLQAVSRVIRFFQLQRHWRQWPACAAVGVLSDYCGEHRHMAEEILNLLARRHLPYRVLDKRQPGSWNLGNLKAVIYPDSLPPDQGRAQRLLDFVQRGGLLIAGPQWRLRPGRPGPQDVYGRFDVLLHGKGRLAIAREPFSDPYLVALDAHLLLGRRHDPIRLWNGGSFNAHYLVRPDGKRAVVQLLNYATRRPAHAVTLGINGAFRRAIFWEPEAEGPRTLETLPAPHGIEIPLPEFPVCAAVELEA
ncbi:MAG: hypothetical protein NZ554_01255 [Bryobacteraceae bacterium]|nr:hypothetical protein [Bryobacteraceae bacterium]